MVANSDLKSGFQTDSYPDLTKNWDPDWNLDFRFQNRFKFGFQISNPD
jgi:hypothetical protein